MKHNTYAVLFFSLLFTTLFSACKKDENSEPDPAIAKSCLVSEHINYNAAGGYMRTVHTYNADSTLQKITEYWKSDSKTAESSFGYADFEYDAQKRVKNIKAYRLINGTYKPVTALTTAFDYSEDGLLRSQAQENGNSILFFYDTNKHLKRIKYNVITSSEEDAMKPSYTEVTLDDKGNILESRFYADYDKDGISTLSGRVKYTYGEQKNPLRVAYFYEYLDDPFAQLSVNNPLTLTRYTVNESGEEVLNNQDTYTYTYNTEGYATQRTSTNANENPKIEYQYTCKPK